MADLKDRPEDFLSLFALMRRIFRILHLVAKLQESILDVVEAIWRRLPIPR